MHHTRLRDKNMKKNIMGMRLLKLAAAFTISVVIITGCAGNGLSQNNQSTISDYEPSSGWSIMFSFPSGAPALNQEAELLCSVKTDTNIKIGYLNIWVVLPDGLELVSGDLSWEGSITAKPEDSISTVRSIVRSTQTGNWEIRVHGYLSPKEFPGITIGPEGYPVFITISKDKAEWGLNHPPGSPLPTWETIPNNYPTPPTAEFSREPTSQVH
jgi:hypothetical protein